MKALVLSIVLILSSAPMALAAGGQEGNGGAGIVRDGRYMTFYSAGLYTEPQPIERGGIPSLTDLISFINSFEYLSERAKFPILKALIPTLNREYYKVKADKFDETTRARLIAEFSRVSGQPAEALQLFAVTDSSSNRTYLLPTFFQLSRTDQMAILFHEAYWILNPRAPYDQVVSAEISFQAVIEQPQNLNRVANFISSYAANDSGEQLHFAVKIDKQTGALNGLLKEGEVPFVSLLGSDYFQCLTKKTDKTYCYGLPIQHLYRLTERYPNSQFLRIFQAAWYKNPISVVVDDGPTYSAVGHTSFLTCSIKFEVTFGMDVKNHYGMLVKCDGDTRTRYLSF